MIELTPAERIIENAATIAAFLEKAISFSHWEGDEGTGFSGSAVGTAYPCGCVVFSTILSDGSLGCGGWRDPCSWDHMN